MTEQSKVAQKMSEEAMAEYMRQVIEISKHRPNEPLIKIARDLADTWEFIALKVKSVEEEPKREES